MQPAEHISIESINFDYIPGEPESRRVWYITLKRSPYNIKPGFIIRVDSFRGFNLPVQSGTMYYKVNDIYGRFIVVDPIGKGLEPRLPSDYYRVGIYSHPVRPQTWGMQGPPSYFDIL